MDAMGAQDPPRPPWLMVKVLVTVQIPDELVGALLDQFLVTEEEGGVLLSELRSGRGLHAFSWHLSSGVDPAPGLERLTLLGVDRYGMVHILH